jgi:guanine nucleotide-binding protein subunit alpha
MGRSIDVDDPLALALAPPSNETPEQRAERERREAEERRISDEIDEQLKAERAALRRRKKPVKVLLLGQSESGESVVSFLSAFVAFHLLRLAVSVVVH